MINMEEENESTEQSNNSKPWLYKKGQSGNPTGKPKGAISMKTWIKNRLETMTDEQREEFMEGLSKDIIWQMAEGRPKQDNELTMPQGVKITFDNSFKKDA